MNIAIDPDVVLKAADRLRLGQIQDWTPAEQIKLAQERSELLQHLPLWVIRHTEERNFFHAYLTRFSFHCSLRGANFREALLDFASFDRCGLQGADFRWSYVKPSAFYNCDLTGADFTGAPFMDEPPWGWRWCKGSRVLVSCNVPESADPEPRS